MYKRSLVISSTGGFPVPVTLAYLLNILRILYSMSRYLKENKVIVLEVMLVFADETIN